MKRFGNKSCEIVAVAALFGWLAAGVGPAVAETAPVAPAVELEETPADGALRIALVEGGASDDAAAHYNANGFEKIWFRAGGDDAPARALLAALRDAPRHGLPRERYDAPLLEAALEAAATGEPAAAAIAELAFTKAYLRYARDVSSGLLEPRSVDRELHVKPPRPAPDALLGAAAAAVSMEAHLQSLAPQSETYRRLMAELSSLTSLAPDAWGPPTPEGPSLRIGDVSDRVAAMRARLIAKGDHVPQPAPELATAVD
ncbi:MAG: hypothetical protein AAFU55_07665, partial [Pseudomonadota bacterium]